MTKKNVEALILQLDTSSDRAADRVIGRLMKLGKTAVPELLRAARDPGAPRIRKWSLQALGAIADKRAAPVLIAALRAERMTVRLHALRGLGRMRSRRSAKAVAECLRDESGGIRVNALTALIEIGDGSVGAAIKRCLSDPQWYVRQQACVACGRLGVKGAGAKLRRLAKEDPRKAVRVAASAALD